MKLQATQPIRVFIDKNQYGNVPTEYTNVGKVPKERRENVSWKGCYYTIEKDEIFFFDRSNNYDTSFFKLLNGAEFKVYTGNPEYFINKFKSRKL